MGKVVPCLIPYKSIFYLKFFDQDKASFDRIKSCPVWKFVLNPTWHCSLGPDPALFFPDRPTRSRAAHACTPPAPLLPHDAGHRLTDAHLRRSCAAAGMPGPVLPPASAWRRPHRTPPHCFVFVLDQAACGPLFSTIAAQREFSPTGLHTASTSPPMSQIGAGVLLRAPEPLLPH
jgi:hypothetical protein